MLYNITFETLKHKDKLVERRTSHNLLMCIVALQGMSSQMIWQAEASNLDKISLSSL